ncbi:MAG: exodeoxyribonuclease VII small subunit [Ignavibacteriae bacterium]|nr:exodeoxyribonuclease VII small subunit [Ignavibacteriota bacterium]
MAKKNKTFEESLKRLQEISELLESNDITLEESLSLYEEGIKLSKSCHKTLENAQLKVEQLNNELEDELKK